MVAARKIDINKGVYFFTLIREVTRLIHPKQGRKSNKNTKELLYVDGYVIHENDQLILSECSKTKST